MVPLGKGAPISEFAGLPGCKVTSLPIKCLGLSLGTKFKIDVFGNQLNPRWKKDFFMEELAYYAQGKERDFDQKHSIQSVDLLPIPLSHSFQGG